MTAPPLLATDLYHVGIVVADAIINVIYHVLGIP